MRLFNIISTRFENFDETIHNYLQKAMESIGINYKSTQIFGVLLNAIKGVMQNAMFYIEDALTEQNIFTAVRKKSIYNLAKISGYVPFYGQSATGSVIISTKSGANSIYSDSTKPSTKFYISNGTQLRDTSTGMLYTIFMPTDDYVIDVSKPYSSHEFKVVEGTYQYAQYTALGNPYETFSVGVNGLWDDNYIEVSVNGNKYSRVGNIYEAGGDDNVYIIRNGYDSLFDIGFGNGVYGKALNEGDTIRVKYLVHSGTSGNIDASTDLEDRLIFDKTLSDAKGNSIDAMNYVSIKLNSDISGGTDADTIEEVKNSIGAQSTSLVYVTPENFKLFLKRFSFVGWCNVFCESNSLGVTGMCLKNTNNLINDTLDYYDISPNDLLLTSHEKKMITDSLENSGKLYAGVQFSLIDPVIRQFAMTCYVKLLDNTQNKDNVISKIKKAVADYFMGISSSTLFISKTSIIMKVMESCSDIIESFDFEFISETNETGYKNGYYTYYKYILDNGVYKYVPYNVTYESDKTACIDDFGNIQLTSELETVLLHGGFKYYTDKTKDRSTKNSITLTDAIQVYFI